MPLREIFAVYSENHTEYMNAVFGQNAEIKQVVPIITIKLQGFQLKIQRL
jgi:hypothetical protein